MNRDCLFLECQLCKKPPYKANQCRVCQSLFCYKCILSTIRISNICPECQKKLICQPINKITQMLLEEIKMYCKFCQLKMSAFAIRKHTKQCQKQYRIKNLMKIQEQQQLSINEIPQCQVCFNQNIFLDQCKYCQKLKCASCLTLQLNKCTYLPNQPNSEDLINQNFKSIIFYKLCKLQLNSFELSNHFQICEELQIYCGNYKCQKLIQRNQINSHILACTNQNIDNLQQGLHLMKKTYSLYWISLLQINVEESQYTSLFNNILGFQTRNQIQETAPLTDS